MCGTGAAVLEYCAATLQQRDSLEGGGGPCHHVFCGQQRAGGSFACNYGVLQDPVMQRSHAPPTNHVCRAQDSYVRVPCKIIKSEI